MRISKMPLLLGLFLLLLIQQTESSGFLQVGFFLYEFRHDSTSPFDGSRNRRPQKQPESPNARTTTTSFDVRDEGDGVTPWKVRSLLPARVVTSGDNDVAVTSGEDDVIPSDGGGSSGRVSPPWRQATTTCEVSSESSPRYRFLLCLDYAANRKSTLTSCRLGHLELNPLPHLGVVGRDIVTFPSTLNLTTNGEASSNPIVLGFDRWNSTVSLDVFVACCGAPREQEGQCRETLRYTVSQTPAPPTLSLTAKRVVLRGRSRLMLYLMLQCDSHYYGPACDVYCYVQFPSIEHAFCNVTTGQRHCMMGWEGAECQIDTNECGLNLCHNSANCVNLPPGSFTCRCKLGTTGRLCEKRKQVCNESPCENEGSCQDTDYGFVCFCAAGYGGYLCEKLVNVTSGMDFIGDSSSLNGTAAFDLNSTTAHTAEPKGLVWEPWYTAAIAACVVLILLIVFVCCLMKSRIFQKRIRASGAFYSVSVVAKTFDNNAFDNDEEEDSILSNSSVDGGSPRLPLPCRSDIKKARREAERRKQQKKKDKQQKANKDVRTGQQRQDGTNYIDIISPCYSTASTPLGNYEGLPNLIHPRDSPLMVHRHPTRLSSAASSPAGARAEAARGRFRGGGGDGRRGGGGGGGEGGEGRGGGGGKSTRGTGGESTRGKGKAGPPAPGSWTPKPIPRKITQLKASSHSSSSPSSSTSTLTPPPHDAYDPPWGHSFGGGASPYHVGNTSTALFSETRQYQRVSGAAGGSSSPEQNTLHFFGTEGVFSISGTLSSINAGSSGSSPSGTPKARPRKTLLISRDGESGESEEESSSSEPKLRYIRRVDSLGYETPNVLYYRPHPWASSREEDKYTRLNRRRADEHEYEKIQRNVSKNNNSEDPYLRDMPRAPAPPMNSPTLAVAGTRRNPAAPVVGGGPTTLNPAALAVVGGPTTLNPTALAVGGGPTTLNPVALAAISGPTTFNPAALTFAGNVLSPKALTLPGLQDSNAEAARFSALAKCLMSDVHCYHEIDDDDDDQIDDDPSASAGGFPPNHRSAKGESEDEKQVMAKGRREDKATKSMSEEHSLKVGYGGKNRHDEHVSSSSSSSSMFTKPKRPFENRDHDSPAGALNPTERKPKPKPKPNPKPKTKPFSKKVTPMQNTERTGPQPSDEPENVPKILDLEWMGIRIEEKSRAGSTRDRSSMLCNPASSDDEVTFNDMECADVFAKDNADV